MDVVHFLLATKEKEKKQMQTIQFNKLTWQENGICRVIEFTLFSHDNSYQLIYYDETNCILKIKRITKKGDTFWENHSEGDYGIVEALFSQEIPTEHIHITYFFHLLDYWKEGYEEGYRIRRKEEKDKKED